jgi:formate/nitrite transporter FocA (FNT family)
VPGVGWGNTLLNWLLAGVGNLVGAVVFVSTSYWYQFLGGRPEKAEISTAEAVERT